MTGLYLYLGAFLVGGLICAIGQLIMDQFKLLPIHITVMFVVLGAFLEIFGAYDWLISIGGGGALMPISSFGHSLTAAAVSEASKTGYFGILLGIFDTTASGISSTILFAFFVALVFKPRG